jgi:MYXO-CTERM domain-containing protein
MNARVKQLSGLALAALVALGLAGRRRQKNRPPWLNPPDGGVREPRRPLQPSGSGAVAAEPPPE